MTKKLLILLPEANIHKIKIGNFRKSFREAPLTATTLAALVPEDLDIDISIIDESIQKIPFDKTYDIVAISIITGTSTRGYELADYYRKKGATVIMGGVHVKLRPEEAAQYADSIVIGFAEHSWPELLRDYMQGQLKPKYENLKKSFDIMPSPRRDLQKNSGYSIPNTVNATRGCKGSCDFCAVDAAKFGWQTREIDSIIEEIKKIPAKRIVFNDVSMGEDMVYFKALLRAMIPLKKKWGGLVSTRVFQDPETLDLLQKSGCSYLLIGFESLNDISLTNMNKGFNRFDEYKILIEQLRSINVILMACFIFGFDEDTLDVFENTVSFVKEYKVNIPRYAIYTPFPGTKSYKRFSEQGRILHNKWEYYDTQHVVFQPKNMTVEQLDDGFKKAYKDTFTIGSSFARTVTSGKNFSLTFGGNLAYRIYLKRLYAEQNRIYKP